MKTKGFTLIELLVVIVIIGILVAIALPNFIKIKDKAKEAETKQNLHSIQLAIERYATDMNGNYPYFLFGGDTLFNAGVANNIWRGNNGAGPVSANWYLPFDMFEVFNGSPEDDYAWTYGDGNKSDIMNGDVESGWGDTLEYEAYMTKYPRNPFNTGDAGTQYSSHYLDDLPPNIPYAAWGGKEGDLMFNMGPWGDLFRLIRVSDREGETYNEFPGQFYYHPRWADGISNHEHQVRQSGYCGGIARISGITPMPLEVQVDEVGSLDVAGYDLAAIGSARTKGQDIDNAVKSSTTWGTKDSYRTGYFTLGQERNPYVFEGDYGDNGDYEERPFSDGRADFLIIHLSSGLDHKVEDFSREG